jgi:hypothetical protein
MNNKRLRHLPTEIYTLSKALDSRSSIVDFGEPKGLSELFHRLIPCSEDCRIDFGTVNP